MTMTIKRCPHCKRELKDTWVTCPRCGRLVLLFFFAGGARSESEDEQSPRRCKVCDNEVGHSDEVCSFCGVRLEMLEDPAWTGKGRNASERQIKNAVGAVIGLSVFGALFYFMYQLYFSPW